MIIVSTILLFSFVKPRCDDDESVAIEVEPELARAIRQRQRITGSAGGKWISAAHRPATAIYMFGTSSAGMDFLMQLVKKRAAASSACPQCAKRLAAHGVALAWCATAGCAKGPVAEVLATQLAPATALLHQAHDMSPDDSEIEFHRERLVRQLAVLEAQALAISSEVPKVDGSMPKAASVPRVVGAGMSAAEFAARFSGPRKPVVLTGVVDDEMLGGRPRWTPTHVAAVAGQRKFVAQQMVPGSIEWAQLEKDATGAVSTVADFVARLEGSNATERGCLFDWSLPSFAPELDEQLATPSCFNSNLLKQTPPGSKYRDSWPSLFVAPAGHTSELHVDTFGSHFWMALMHGKKRWTFFPREDLPLLYPSFSQSTDPAFAAELGAPDLRHQPLLAASHPLEVVLEPGELLFVPAGWPHRVETLETSVAVSTNFVDGTNLKGVLEELRVAGLRDPEDAQLRATLARVADGQ